MKELRDIPTLCRELGITQGILAKRLGMTDGQLSAMLRRDFHSSLLERMAEALGIPVADLFEQDKDVTVVKKVGEITVIIKTE